MATNLENIETFFNENQPTKQKTSINTSSMEVLSINDILKKAHDLNIETDPLDIKSVVKNIFNIEIKEDKFDKGVSGFLERIGAMVYFCK